MGGLVVVPVLLVLPGRFLIARVGVDNEGTRVLSTKNRTGVHDGLMARFTVDLARSAS